METKMNLFRTAAAAFVVTAGLAAAHSASAYERWINIHNTSNVTVTAVQISHIDTRSWGPNILPGVINAGYQGVVDPVDTQGYCRFDVKLSYADGTSAEIYNVNLCEALDLVTDGYTYQVFTI
jgi:hypothetical protein